MNNSLSSFKKFGIQPDVFLDAFLNKLLDPSELTPEEKQLYYQLKLTGSTDPRVVTAMESLEAKSGGFGLDAAVPKFSEFKF